jgi:hypothetical protein
MAICIFSLNLDTSAYFLYIAQASSICLCSATLSFDQKANWLKTDQNVVKCSKNMYLLNLVQLSGGKDPQEKELD